VAETEIKKMLILNLYNNMKKLIVLLGAVSIFLTSCNKEEETASASVSSIVVVPVTLTIYVGSTRQVQAFVFPDNASDKALTWSSSNEAVASVDVFGDVTALSGGAATITATAGGKTAACLVTVTDN
jgi:uncharacterized protein YjdB